MASTQSKLGATYVVSNWIVLTLSAALLLYCYMGSDINIDLIPASNTDRRVTAYTAVIFFLFSWVYQNIQWRLEATETKVRYLSISVHVVVNIIALLVSYLCYPILKTGTYFENIPFWWIPAYITLGLLTGLLLTVLCLAALTHRRKEEAQRLSLPTFPYASKAQFKLWLPVLILILTSYFVIQCNVSAKVRLFGTILFTISFLKEIGTGLLPLFLSQDSGGNRIRFLERTAGLKKAFDRHDYDLNMLKAIEIGEIPTVDWTLPPSTIQKNVVRELSKEDLLEFQGRFLGQDQNGNLKMEVMFKDNKRPHIFVDVPNDYVQKSLSNYLEKNNPASEADMHKAISHAFNEATIKVLTDRSNIESDLGGLVLARQYDVLVQRLDENTEDVNKIGAGGWTPLCHASANGDIKALTILLDHAADPDIKNILEITPLHYGVRYLNLKVCKLLLDFGASPNVQDSQGATPLMIAAKLGGQEIVKLLLKRNADVSIKDHSRQDALKYATDSKRGNIARILRGSRPK